MYNNFVLSSEIVYLGVKRKWNWIGHTLHKETGAIEKSVLEWNSQGYRRRGRPKRRW